MLKASTVCGGILFALLCASTAQAQSSFEAGPIAGYYRPTADFDPSTVFTTDLPRQPKDLAGVAWGAKARLWFGPRFGAEMQVSVISSERDSVFTPAGPLQPPSARMTIATLQLLYSLSPDQERVRPWISAGPGLVHHGGDAYEEYGSPTSPAAAVALGASVRVGGHFRITAGATGLLYPYEVEMPPELAANGDALQEGFQRDLMLHVGLTWSSR
jgi:hypothetical protein